MSSLQTFLVSYFNFVFAISLLFFANTLYLPSRARALMPPLDPVLPYVDLCQSLTGARYLVYFSLLRKPLVTPLPKEGPCAEKRASRFYLIKNVLIILLEGSRGRLWFSLDPKIGRYCLFCTIRGIKKIHWQSGVTIWI